MERKFKSHMVDVRGLSRKEAKEKRKRAYREFMLYRDLKEAYHADTGKDKCKRKVHTSRTYVNYTKKTLNKAYLSDSTKNAILGQMMKGKPE